MNNQPIIYRQSEFWTREQIESDPDRYYIFGDNEAETGMGGQACIRGLNNAFGIPSLKSPGEFWSDETYEANCRAIDAAIEKIPTDKPWVLSANGIGTGIAELDKRAPKTFAYLGKAIDDLEYVIGIRSVKAGGELESDRNFVWPIAPGSVVECPDWDPNTNCANGLHFLLPGQNNPGVWYDDLRLVLKIARRDMVVQGGKAKCKKCIVLFAGTHEETCAWLNKWHPGPWYRSTQTGGYRSTQTGGYGSTQTGGYRSTQTGGDGSTQTGGDGSTQTGGYRSTQTGGYGSTQTGGYGSTQTGGYGSVSIAGPNSKQKGTNTLLVCRWCDHGYHFRTAIAGVDVKNDTFYTFNRSTDKWEEVMPNA